MITLGFEKYVEPLKVYLSRYRESSGLINPPRDDLPKTKDEDVLG